MNAGSRACRFNFWDRFLLPAPFGRGVFVLGGSVYYNQDEDMEDFQLRLYPAMEETNSQARKFLEKYAFSAV